MPNSSEQNLWRSLKDRCKTHENPFFGTLTLFVLSFPCFFFVVVEIFSHAFAPSVLIFFSFSYHPSMHVKVKLEKLVIFVRIPGYISFFWVMVMVVMAAAAFFGYGQRHVC